MASLKADLNRPIPVESGAVAFILCEWQIERLQDPAAFFMEARRILVLGGTFLLSTNVPVKRLRGWLLQAKFRVIWTRHWLLRRYQVVEALAV